MPDVPDNFLLEPTPHDEAVAWLKDKPVVSRKVFDAMVPELRARTFLITGIEDANVAQELRDIVAELPAGESWEGTKKKLVAKLGPWLSADDPEQKAAKARAELLLRTHGFQSYQVTQHRVMREQEDVFPFWQYLSLDDEKVRPGHAALNLKVAPAKSPFWHDHSPPWQWGCRCRKVPLMEEEVDEMVGEDQKLPPEKQRVQVGPALNLLEQGRMYDRYGRQISIKSDRQKGKANGFVFDPDALTLPLDQLKARYDATTWGEFEKSMQAAKLDDGRTVWAWLNGAKAGKAPKPPNVVPPAPNVEPAPPTPEEKPLPEEPKAEGMTTPAGTALAGKLDADKLSKKERARVNGVLALIDQVHGDGPLSKIPVTHKPGRGNLGVFRHWPNGAAVDIGYKKPSKVAHAELTLAHEIGHWLDHSGAPGTNILTSTIKDGPLAEFMRVARQSQAVLAIQAKPQSSARSYYLKSVEIFARAYAQFIAEETQDPTMLAQVAQIRSEGWPERQWSTEDFKPLRDEMRKAFVGFGWMKEVAP